MNASDEVGSFLRYFMKVGTSITIPISPRTIETVLISGTPTAFMVEFAVERILLASLLWANRIGPVKAEISRSNTLELIFVIAIVIGIVLILYNL